MVGEVVGDFRVVLEPWEFEDRVLGGLERGGEGAFWFKSEFIAVDFNDGTGCG